MSTPEVKTAVTLSEATVALRRLDVEAKQELVAKLLHDSQSEGLLILLPANFRWLTAGADPVGFFGRDERPGLFYTHQQRFLITSSVDSQRFFDVELDRLGFQLKEWQWTTRRDQLIADMVYGRKIASDQPFRDCKDVASYFPAARRVLSQYEADHLRRLGHQVAHAVEATARNVEPGETESEIAGHLAHRLVRHGIHPESIQVTGDGRNQTHLRRSHTAEPSERSVFIQVTGRREGLFATCARTVWFGEMEPTIRTEYDLALRMGAAQVAVATPGAKVTQAIEAGQILLRGTPYEHDWRRAPTVALTGREPSEGLFLPSSVERWIEHWAAVWQARVGSAAIIDTFILQPDGWENLTPPSEWPVRRVTFQGKTYDRADVLVRD